MFHAPSRTIAALVALGLVGGVGCVSLKSTSRHLLESTGLVKPVPPSQIITSFEPTIHHLPDPTRDGQLAPGLAGCFWLVDSEGQFVDVDGSFTVFIEDVTQREPGQMTNVPEAWHFDAATLRKLKSSHEKFGKNTVVFLPWPENWKYVAQLRVQTEYEPAGGGVKLGGPVQILTVDYTNSGKQLWSEKNEPSVLRGIPNYKRDLAKGSTKAITGFQSTGGSTVPAGGSMPMSKTAPATPNAPIRTSNSLPKGPTGPSAAASPPANSALPDLPPPLAFDPLKPKVDTKVGSDGTTIHTTAIALPPGETLPPGWVKTSNGIQPVQGQDPRKIVVPIVPPVQNTAPIPNVAPVPPGFDPNSPVGSWATPTLDPNTPLPTVTLPGRR